MSSEAAEQTTVAKKILVVDDSPSILRLWTRVFEKEGFSVITAPDGKEALKQLSQHRPSVIFTDLSMPEMGGMELLKQIKQNETLSSVCVNIITGVGTIEGAVEGMRLGACDYITKPCDLNELVVMTYRCMRHYAGQLETSNLKKTVRRLTDLNKLKTDFVSNISHELRTPLFSMNAALELFLSNVSDNLDESSRKLYDIIRRNYERLVQIVANILDFSRIENGTLRPKFQDIGLTALAEKTLSDFAPLFSRRNIKTEFTVENPFFDSIQADPMQVEQILINLLGNAIKFTPPGGNVGIRLAYDEKQARACVWDTGRGIAKEYLERVFDRFYQVDGSMTREAGGAGIGLSIVKAIVEMHGGRVWVESQENHGSQFYFVLPKHQIKTGESHESTESEVYHHH